MGDRSSTFCTLISDCHRKGINAATYLKDKRNLKSEVLGVTLTPGRREPRATKRRPKTYQLLTRPRHQFQEIQHRDHYRAAA